MNPDLEEVSREVELELNSDAKQVTCEVEPEDFVNEFVKAHQEGFGFVPFFGAGLSVSAGIPIVREITPYLRRCIAKATGLADLDWTKIRSAWKKFANQAGQTDPKAKSEVLRKPFDQLASDVWNPRRDNWPRFSDSIPMEFDDIKRNLRGLMDEVAQRKGEKFCLFGNDEHFWDEVIGASAEWRTSMLFLSRLVLAKDYGDNKAPLGMNSDDASTFGFTSPSRDVVDGFLSHLIADKTPAHEHRLFAHMADILRIRISLTTNFDDLYERAFYDAGKNITVFDVHLEAGMPPANLVSLNHHSLIKMHGGKYGFRADYSLEAAPSLDDQRRFISYLAGNSIDDHEWHDTDAPRNSSRHLLVMGLGGRDTRTQQLVISALRWLPDLKIFWVCYSRSDIKFVSDLFHSAIGDDVKNRIFITRNVDTGLLLMEIYQSITENVPRGGVEFPAVWRVPLPPEPFRPKGCQTQYLADIKNLSEQIEEAESRSRADGGSTAPRDKKQSIVIVQSKRKSATDCVTIGSECFRLLVDGGKKCVWLDVDEIDDKDELRERLLETLALRSGIDYCLPIRTSATHVNKVKEADAEALDNFAKELNYVVRGQGEDFVVFLNCCERRTDVKQQVQKQQIVKLIAILAGETSLTDPIETSKIRVVLTAYSEYNYSKAFSRLKLPGFPNSRKNGTNPCIAIVEPEYCAEFTTFDGTTKDLRVQDPKSPHIEDFKKIVLDHQHPAVSSHGLSSEGFLRFLVTLCAFHRPRYPVSLAIWTALGDLDQFDTHIGHTRNAELGERWEMVGNLLRFLREKRIIRRKPGGLVWMHATIRDDLFHWAAEEHAKLINQSHWDGSRLPILDSHQGIADWYGKLFFASQDPVALFESLRHRVRLTDWYFFERRDGVRKIRQNIVDVRNRYLSGLLEAISLLGMAKTLIRSTNHTAGSSIWLSNFIERDLDTLIRDLNKAQRSKKNSRTLNSQLINATEAIKTLKADCKAALFCIAIDVGDTLTEPRTIRPNPVRQLSSNVINTDEIQNHLDNAYISTVNRSIPWSYYYLDEIITLILNESDNLKYSVKAKQDWFQIRNGTANATILSAREAGGCFARRIAGENFYATPDRARVLRQAVRCCRHAIFVDLARAEAIRACERVGIEREGFPVDKKVKSTWLNCLDRAVLTYHFGAEITRWFSVGSNQKLVNRERARLKVFLAMALTERGNYAESRRRISEAFGLVDDHVGFRDNFWQAVLNICQAEASLTRCRDSTPGFGSLRNHLCEYFFDKANLLKGDSAKGSCNANNVENNATVKKIKDICLSPDNRRIAHALIDDAETLLSQHENGPVGGRQNVLWLERFWLIRLKSFEYRTFAALEPENSPLRVFGSKEAPTSSLTEADIILRDIVRVNRGDVFLLSRAIHSYLASMAAVFFVWRTTQANAQRLAALKKRLDDCANDCLKVAVFQLDKDLRARIKNLKNSHKPEALDPWAYAYSSWVHKHTVQTLIQMGKLNRAEKRQLGTLETERGIYQELLEEELPDSHLD